MMGGITPNNGDRVFIRFYFGMLAILMLYGFGMMAVILFGDKALATKMLVGFAGMFSGLIGLGSGYVLGRSK
jgi:hypothetical protein